jgi:hypothetical protein
MAEEILQIVRPDFIPKEGLDTQMLLDGKKITDVKVGTEGPILLYSADGVDFTMRINDGQKDRLLGRNGY